MTTHLFSASTGGFYIKGLHQTIPEDAVEVSEDQYSMMLEGMQLGKTISVNNGKPTLVDFRAPKVTWDQIRLIRDTKLAKCDWTQLADVKMTKEQLGKWNTYRQKLRDITETFATPEKVVWPMAPNEPEEQ